MNEDLRNAFQQYDDLASRVLKAGRGTWSLGGESVALEDTAELRLRVDYLEKDPEFERLVHETNRAFAEDPNHISELFCQSAVGNFFRRSGHYLDSFEGLPRADGTDQLFERYCDAYRRQNAELTYLAPLEGVRFAEPRMDFDTFTICNFTADKLDEMFQNQINRAFFPFAVTDAEQLSDYWFLVVKERVATCQFGGEILELEQPEVLINYTSYARRVETALKVLTLSDWQANVFPHDFEHAHLPENMGKRWLRFNVPFVATLDDNLLKSPLPAPDLSRLETEPDFDPQTGEERGPIPVIVIDLDNDQTELFRRFTERILNRLSSSNIQQDNWQFLDVALGYLTKAFFAKGLEELLWHITALEALLGEKGYAVTQRLAERIASILAKDDGQRNTITEQFKTLYNLRCDFVHGRELKTHAYIGHLRLARDIARRVALWFLHYLGQLQAVRPQNPLTREECLELLDKKTGSPLLTVIGQLPSGFPHVPEWLA